MSCFFFFNDTATTEIYTLSLHDALPICVRDRGRRARAFARGRPVFPRLDRPPARLRRAAAGLQHRVGEAGRARPSEDRESTRLNSSHRYISDALLCFRKKKKINAVPTRD